MDFARRLANHCAPAMAGIKPANLISCPFTSCEGICQYMEDLRVQGLDQEICFHSLGQRGGCRLFLVFRKNVLLRYLQQLPILSELNALGYPTHQDLESLLAHLRRRLEESEREFPHEIGYFLGYPKEDVKGFTLHKGQNFCFCGYWKVYHQPEKAEKLFERYTRCRQSVLAKLEAGMSLETLFGMKGC